MYIYDNEKNMAQAYKKSKQKEDIPIFNYTSNINDYNDSTLSSNGNAVVSNNIADSIFAYSCKNFSYIQVDDDFLFQR